MRSRLESAVALALCTCSVGVACARPINAPVLPPASNVDVRDRLVPPDAMPSPSIARAAGPRGNVARIVFYDGLLCAHFENKTVQCVALERQPDEAWSPTITAMPDMTGLVGASGNCRWFDDGSMRCAEDASPCASTFVRYRPASKAPRGAHPSCVDQQDGSTICRSTFACASPSRLRDVVDATAVKGGQTCARLAENAIACADPHSTEILPVTEVKGAIAVSTGHYQSCALMPTGTVRCWPTGAAWESARDHDDSPVVWAPYRPVVATVDHLETVTAVDVAEYHACALLQDRTVRCWGDNAFHQLDGTGLPRVEPVKVQAIADAVDVRVSYSRSCALLGNGSLRCWGANRSGTFDPIPIDRVPGRAKSLGAIGFAMDDRHTCALRKGGDVICTGGCLLARCGLGYTAAQAAADTKLIAKCDAPVVIPWLP